MVMKMMMSGHKRTVLNVFVFYSLICVFISFLSKVNATPLQINLRNFVHEYDDDEDETINDYIDQNNQFDSSISESRFVYYILIR